MVSQTITTTLVKYINKEYCLMAECSYMYHGKDGHQNIIAGFIKRLLCLLIRC